MEQSAKTIVKIIVPFLHFSNERGYSLIDFAMTMGLVAVIGAGIFSIYKFRVAPAAWANTRSDTFKSVVTALDTAKGSRGNAYPAQATSANMTSIASLSPYVGSTATDLSNWTYQCAAGGASTMTVSINAADSPGTDAMNILKDQITNAITNSIVTVDTANKLVNVAITPVVCN